MVSLSYNPVDYWGKRGTGMDTGLDHPIHKLHFNSIKSILNDKTEAIESVLEVGCGYGRITRMLLEYLPHIKRYDAVDISPTRIAAARNYIPYFKYEEYLNLSQVDFEYTDFDAINGYDLVISVECLMHQLPSKIEKWIRKMISYSRYYVMNLDWYEEGYRGKIAPWNFIHDYNKIYMDAGIYTLEKRQVTNNQCLFAAEISEMSWIPSAFTNHLPSSSNH